MITYTTITRTGNEPVYKFAEIKYGKIVAINEHWVPLEEYRKFFSPNALFIDITNVEFDGEVPQIGDAVTSDENGYRIIHSKAVYSPAEMKAYAVEMMKLTRDKKELEPIEYNGHMFDADKDAITRMDMARKVLEDTGMPSIVWTTFDNDHTALTVEDFKAINTAQAMRSSQLHNRYNELKNFIYGLTDDQISILTEEFNWDYNIEG